MFASLTRTRRTLGRAVGAALIAGQFFSGQAAAKAPTAISNPAPPAVAGSINPATAAQLAAALGVPPADLLAADLMGSDPEGVGVADSPVGEWFPTSADGAFAILATGLAADADTPNDSESLTTILTGTNNTGDWDLTRLHLQLAVPSDANCLTFDYQFLSEEFPEFVGSIFNDSFTAQLDNSSLTISGTVPLAPGNFAVDTLGNLITINTVFGVYAPTASTYDGATPLLRLTVPVITSATIDLYFSIQDLGDSHLDSAVFLDRFQWSLAVPCLAHTQAIDRERLHLPLALWDFESE